MEHIYSSDKPISKSQDDRFQRYNFSARIAETIKQRSDNDGVVIGIYGEWGEGKTSVLNFIETELKNDDSVIAVKFNPWRYNDEETLIRGYFAQISKALGKELETKKEKVGSILKKYGTITDFFGLDISKIGDILSDIQLENLRNRVDQFLRESKSKLVIFVDDIDRLDKQELYSIFKLVKLTADFQNTTYILSFDERMVASAIGERYGAGNSDAGHNFLEKIIQVPLQVPKAQISSLRKYCFDRLNKVIEDSGLSLTKTEIDNFIYQFSQGILLRLKTPRLAVRYVNTLAFSIPLLKGEVNNVDLLLVEALKIFYPNHYEFVKYNSHYFTTSYDREHSYLGNDIEKKKKELSEKLELLAKNLSPQEETAINSLLKYLFPRLNEAFHNRFTYNGSKTYSLEKRIVSPDYFNRYFLYSILDGELSDILFDDFAISIRDRNLEEIRFAMAQIINTSTVESFIFKAERFEKMLDWPSVVKFIYAVTSADDLFPQHDISAFSFGMRGPHTQVCMLITQFLKNSDQPPNEIFDVVINIFKSSKTLDFTLEIRRWLEVGKSDIFSTEQENKIDKEIIEKALCLSENKPLFETFENHAYTIFELWLGVNELELNKYLNEIIKKDPIQAAQLLYTLTSTIISSARPKPYKVDFDNDTYNFVAKIANKELIHGSLLTFFGKEISQGKAYFVNREDTQTFINILRQFEHWYENAITE